LFANLQLLKSWLGKAHYLLEGVIHTYAEEESQYKEWTKVKHVPQSRIVAVFDGSWKNRIRWRQVPPTPSAESDLDPESDYATLLDLSILRPIPKVVRPISQQLPYESRRLWEKVTNKLLKKEYGDATREKVIIEQRQRDEAADRKKKGIE
jgi:oxysterol-binding protein-related protein 9/10/11